MPFTLDQKTEDDAARAVRMFASTLPSTTAAHTFAKRLTTVCAYFGCTPASLTQADIERWYTRAGGAASPSARATRRQLKAFISRAVSWGLL